MFVFLGLWVSWITLQAGPVVVVIVDIVVYSPDYVCLVGGSGHLWLGTVGGFITWLIMHSRRSHHVICASDQQSLNMNMCFVYGRPCGLQKCWSLSILRSSLLWPSWTNTSEAPPLFSPSPLTLYLPSSRNAIMDAHMDPSDIVNLFTCKIL